MIRRSVLSRLLALMSTLVVGLLAERAAVGQAGLTTGGVADDGLAGAGAALNLGGGVAVDGDDLRALGAADVHEVGVGALDETALLVLLALLTDVGVGEIGIEETHAVLTLNYLSGKCRKGGSWLKQ